MRGWYVRDRGRVIGPFTTEQILDMRERGQVQGYHEVSPDQKAWKAVDLIASLGGSPPVKKSGGGIPVAGTEATKGRPPAPDNGRRKYLLAVGGIVAVVLIGSVAVAGVLYFRGRSGDDGASAASGGGLKVPEGAIKFGSRTSVKDRDQVLAESVGLVIAGIVRKEEDGAKTEIPQSTGSGFAVTPDGYFITNRHVVEKLVNFRGSDLQRQLEKKQSVTLDPKLWVFFGRENKYEAEVVHVSSDFDLAILKLNRPAPRFFSICQMDDSRIPMLDSVSSLGFPGTDRDAMDLLNPNNKGKVHKGAPIDRAFQDPDFHITKENGGIKRSAVKGRPDAKLREAYYLAHTARIAGGNSGGPLITPDGTVIGINTLGITIKIGDIEINKEGQNFAMTMSQLRKEIDRNAAGVIWRDLSD